METYCCQYATDSAEIKARWELTMTRGESQAVLEMLDPCQNLPGVEVWTTLGTTMRELKPEPTEEPETSFQSSWATRIRRRHKARNLGVGIWRLLRGNPLHHAAPQLKPKLRAGGSRILFSKDPSRNRPSSTYSRSTPSSPTALK